MGYLQLRLLFELLCDGLEEENAQLPLHFEGAYGVEVPSCMLMIFVFQEGLMLCKFAVEDNFDQPRALGSFSDALTMDECLDMQKELNGHVGAFSELFKQ